MYEKTFKLRDNEIPAKVNAETGEVVELKSRPNNLPLNKVVFDGGHFKKTFESSWDYLLKKLSPVELKIVVQMSQMARMNSNSLNPLNNETSMSKIAETFNVDRRKVNTMFGKLFRLGVYAEFRFGSVDGIKHYWVLNPYISFKGKTIDIGIADLFRETKLAELYLETV